MENVREQYEDLKKTMATFQVGLSECLAKAEAEFLTAYRAHMLEVHRELQELRDKLSEAESSILKDDSIQVLERDGSWQRAAQKTSEIVRRGRCRCPGLEGRVGPLRSLSGHSPVAPAPRLRPLVSGPSSPAPRLRSLLRCLERWPAQVPQRGSAADGVYRRHAEGPALHGTQT
jgi:hypothetical protein